MFTAALKLLVCAVLTAFWHLKKIAANKNLLLLRLPPGLQGLWPPSILVERRCAKRMEAFAVRLLSMRAKINLLLSHIRDGNVQEEIDADFGLRTALKEVKEDIRELRCQVVAWQTSQRYVHVAMRLKVALATLEKIAEETCSAADQLQWEIAERDADFALRKRGCADA
jgi:hypothetical protein